ncbi:MAG: hypothetical protein EOO27_16290 [Comamonadaceae bacterium]|nr:MAG: hypothetical protein EOO27_16290 [Comamonadaceae bacterium]
MDGGFPERAGEALPRLDALVLSAVRELQARIVTFLETDDGALTAAAASLLAGAGRCGRIPTSPKDIDLLNALLWVPEPNHQRPDAAARRPEWLDAYRAYVDVRQAAVKRFIAGIGAAQGTGGVHALDVNRLLPLLRTAWKRLQEDETLVVPTWCKDADTRSNALARAAGPQLEHWRGLVGRARDHVPAGTSYLETVDALIETTKVGAEVGLVKVNNLPALGDSNDAAKALDGSSIAAVEKVLALADEATGGARLALVGSDVGTDLDKIVAFLEASASWVGVGLDQAAAEGDVATDLDASVQQAVDAWLGILNEFSDVEPSAPLDNDANGEA